MIHQESRVYREICLAEDNLYLLPSKGNNLGCYKFGGESIDDVKLPFNQMGLADELYQTILYYEKKIIYVPASAKTIGIFEILTRKWIDIMVPEPVIPYNDNDLCKDSRKFTDAYVCGEKVYFIPSRYPGILVLNMNTLELRVETDWYTEFSGDMLFPGDALFPSGGCTYEGKIYVPSGQNNIVLEIDKDSSAINLYSLGQDDTYYSCICGANHSFWLAGGKKTITKWGMQQAKITEIEYPQDFQIVKEGNPFSECISWRQYVIFIPSCVNMFVIVNTDTNDVQGIPLEENFLKKENHFGGRFKIAKTTAESFYMYDNFKQKLLYVNAGGEVEEQYIKTALEEMLEHLTAEGAEQADVNAFGAHNFGNKIYEECLKTYRDF